MKLPFKRIILAAVALVLATGLWAQDEKPYSLSDKTSDELTKVQKLLETKDYAGSLVIVDAQYKRVDPNSYDAGILLQVKAQILLQDNKQLEAIQPLETCLMLSDSHTPHFFEDKVTLEFVYFLAQLYFQEGTSVKDPKRIEVCYDKAEQYMERWTKLTPKLTTEPVVFYASLLFNRATQDGEKVDKARLERSLKLVETALTLEIRPKDNLYLLKLACLLQMARYKDAAEIIELLLAKQPDHRTYWEQLAAIYLNLEEPVRYIVTIERAKSYGFMNTQKDNYNLVGIYFNLGQFEKASELLEKGLKDGSLESDESNWKLLVYSYLQLSRQFKAIDALERAVKAVPTSGTLEFMLAQNLFSVSKVEEAIPHAQAAVKKGGISRIDQAYLFLAYLCLETKKYDIALTAVDKAIEYPDSAAEGKRMKKAIQDAIAEREQKLKNM